MDIPATEKQKKFILTLLDRAGYDEPSYISDFTAGKKTSVEALTIKEASDVIEDLKTVLGWDD